MGEKEIKLNAEDWKLIISSSYVKVGKKSIEIKLFTLESLCRIIGRVSFKLKDDGVKLQEIFENIPKLLQYLPEEVPLIVSEATGLNAEDVEKFPAALQVRLLKEIVAINNAGKDSLLKNFRGLAEEIGKVMENPAE